jgi:hypothetical protein
MRFISGTAARQVAAFGQETRQRFGRVEGDQLGDAKLSDRRDGVESDRRARRGIPDQFRREVNEGQNADRQHDDIGGHDVAEATHGASLRRLSQAACRADV